MPFVPNDGHFSTDELPPQKNQQIPWTSDKTASYVYYDCNIGVVLDSGIIVHNRLPQVDNGYDTLSSASIDDPNLDKITDLGVNLSCIDQYTDVIQRMGHAQYWFRLWGQALRVGYQIPIPGIKYIGGVPAIPYDRNPQWAYNRVVPGGNFGGALLWHAQWSLWYTTAVPPVSDDIPIFDPTALTKFDTKPPKNIQPPFIKDLDDNTVIGNPAGANAGSLFRKPGNPPGQ